jgi:hypothetical protein
MIFNNNLIISSLIIVTKVIRMKRRAFDFLGFNAEEVYLLVVKNFTFFMVSQMTHEEFKGFGRCYWIPQVLNLLL